MKKVSAKTAIAALFILVLFSLTFAQNEEHITITTYYPSPFGSYRDLTVARNLRLETDPNNPANDGPQIEWRTSSDPNSRHWNIDQLGDRLRFFTEDINSGAGQERATILENGNVGIGITDPTTALHVSGGGVYVDNNNFGGTPVVALALGDTDTGLNSAGDGQLDVFSNNINTMSIRNNDVGIGTTTPQARIDIADTLNPGDRYLLVGNDAYLTDIDQANTLGIYGNQDNRVGNIELGMNGPILTGTFDVNKQRTRLGIGSRIFTPTAALHVLSESATIALQRDGSQSKLYIASGADDGQVSISDTYANPPYGPRPIKIFHANGQGEVTINPDDNLLVLRNSYGNLVYPTARLVVSNSAAAPDDLLHIITQTGYATYVTRFIINGSGNVGIGTSNPGTYTCYINGSGYLRAAAWDYGSDRRLKENINYIQSGLDVIERLKPAKFDYIKGDKKQAGFIAQDVQEVLPDIVTKGPDGMLGTKNEAIIPYLVKAIQEQQKEIEILKADIKILKAVPK